MTKMIGVPNIFIFIFSISGCLCAWEEYGNYELMQMQSQYLKDKQTASQLCSNVGGRLVEPVVPSLEEAVLSAVSSWGDNYGVFWTGLVRNTSYDQSWIGYAFSFESTALNWEPGENTNSTGSCLAMNVRPTGIQFFPEECSVIHKYICQKLETFIYFEEVISEEGISFNYSKVFNTVSHDNCEKYCLVDNLCTEYHYANGQCGFLDSSSIIPPPPVTCNLINCTNVNGTNENCVWTCSNDTFTSSTYYRRMASSCGPLEDPKFGYASGGNVSATFGCIVEPYLPTTQDIICEDDGRWSNVPHCHLPEEMDDCPIGWEHFQGSCYFVVASITKTWFEIEAACSEFNAAPLYIDSEEEINFIDKLLYFHGSDKFWTGGTNRYIDNVNTFAWCHKYRTMTYGRWDNASLPVGNECVHIVGNGTSFRFDISDSCFTANKYICKKGRVNIGNEYCMSNSWCNGGGLCGGYSGLCYCPTRSMDQIGPEYENTTKCTKKLLHYDNKIYWVSEIPETWNMAVATCKNFGGSIFTPLDTDMEDFTMLNFHTQNEDIYWTGLVSNYGTLQQEGPPDYDLSAFDISYLPIMNTLKSNKRRCLFMRVWQMGVRFYTSRCDRNEKYFICVKSAGAAMASKGMIGNPYTTHYSVMSIDECEMHCKSNASCLSLVYNDVNLECDLFSHAFSGTPAGHLIQRTIQGCGKAVIPRNSSLGTLVAAPNGYNVSFNYTCHSSFKIPDGWSNNVTCEENGQWNQVPVCIPETGVCPRGFEYYKTSCYYVSRDWSGKEDFDIAKQKCLNKDAYLLEVNSLDEMMFLTKLLSFSPSSYFWSGGNDIIINGYYTWSIAVYTQLLYRDWFFGPSGSEAYNCMALSKTFNYTEQDRVYFVDDYCGSYYNYICETKTLYIGFVGCDAYGEYSCQLHATCQNNVCRCIDYSLQIGDDNLTSTTCNLTLNVGSPGCAGYDDLCKNEATCQGGICLCPSGRYQNGPDDSPSTTCEIGVTDTCKEGWTYLNHRCYQVFTGFTTFYFDIPPIRCAKNGGYLAVIPDLNTTDLISKLGTTRSCRWVGLKDYMNTKQYDWTDGSDIAFENFLAVSGVNESIQTLACVFVNEAGYWQKSTCYDPLVTEYACERPSKCPIWPLVDNADYPTIDHDVGASFYYTCERGFALSQNHTGYIECQFNGDISVWTTPPVCIDHTQEMFTDLNTSASAYATVLETTVADTLLNCTADCLNNIDCVGIDYKQGSSNCRLLSEMSLDVGSGLPALSFTALWSRTIVCSEVPTVAGATFTLTGKMVDDTLTYTCDINYYMHRGSSPVLKCQSDGQWDHPPPTCIGRFKRKPLYSNGGAGNKLIWIYEAVTSADECEKKCLMEIKARCLMSVFLYGECRLYERPLEQRSWGGDFVVFPAGKSVISELRDSYLEMYDVTFLNTVTDIPGLFYEGVSREFCAMDCQLQSLQNCNAFMFYGGNCSLYDVQKVSLQSTVDNYEVYLPREGGCSDVVGPPNMILTDDIRQVPHINSIGDVKKVKCTIFGEEIINSQSDKFECQYSRKWSHMPVCRNLCDQGWFMMNYTCYKIFDSPTNFWDTYTACHSLNAGLVNVEDNDEMLLLQNLWNNTGATLNDFWLGLYSNLGSWHWTERLGGDVSQIFPSLAYSEDDHRAVSFDPESLNMSVSNVDATKGYICKKAAGKLACPDGWLKFRNKCFKVETSPETFSNAEAYCQTSYGGNLASLHSVADLDVISELVNKTIAASAFVGLERKTTKEFKWTDGTFSDFRYHKTSDCCVYDEKCAIVNITHFALEGCTVAKPFVCQTYIDDFGTARDFSQLPCSTDEFCAHPDFQCTGFEIATETFQPRCYHKGCPAPFKYYEGGCYHALADKKRNYVQSESACHGLGGHIVTMQGMLEEHYVMDVMQLARPINHENVFTFMGVNNLLTPEYVSMVTRETPKFKQTSLTAKCAMMHLYLSPGGWANSGCSDTWYAVCERDIYHQTDDHMYEGCFNVTSTGVSWLDAVMIDPVSLTQDVCIDWCSAEGYKYAVLTNGDTCGCSNNRGKNIHIKVSDCNSACPGNASQICGGVVFASVYRVTENPCSSTMTRDAVDPCVCYSMTERVLTHKVAKLDCMLQGGELAIVATPTAEEKVYNQVILGASKATETDKVWIGLYKTETWADEGSAIRADWYMFSSMKDTTVHYQTGAQIDISQDGSWESHSPSDNAFYSCWFRDKSRTVNGFHLQRQWNGTHATQISEDGRTLLVHTSFDFGCFNNRDNCPRGFILMFWLFVKDDTKNHVLFTTGDCSSLDVASDGFCVFYRKESGLVEAIYKSNLTILRSNFSIATSTWKHFLFYFKDNATIYSYIDGYFSGEFYPYSVLQLVRIVNTKQIFFKISNLYNLKNVTFIPSAPDEFILEMIKTTGYQGYVSTDWTKFDYCEKDKRKPESSVGVDGSGLHFPHHGFNYVLDDYKITTTFELSLGLWVNIPVKAKGRLNFLSIGDSKDEYSSLDIYYQSDVDMLSVYIKDMTDREITASTAINKGSWQHIAVTVKSNNLNVYLNGSLATTGHSIPTTLINNPTDTVLYAGNVICPVGWQKIGMSCYSLRILNSTNTTDNYWSFQKFCESYGGYIIVVDNQKEKNQAENFLGWTGNTMSFMGHYDRDGRAATRTWVNQNGVKTTYEFFTDTWSPLNFYVTYNQNATGLYSAVPYNAVVDNGMCEINHRDQKTRKMKGLHCPIGWRYFDDHCYSVGGVTANVTDASEHCAESRSKLVEINSLDEQQFLSGFAPSNSTNLLFYIGAWVLRENNATDYVWSNLRPITFTHWSSEPAVSPDKDCAVMNCTSTPCRWWNTSCSELHDYVCEKPAELQCATGWRAFKDRCISVYEGSGVETKCVDANTDGLSISDSAELEEFLHTFDLGILHCLTSGLDNTLGGYVWKLSLGSQETYFSGTTLPGSGPCVGITSSGFQLGPCSLFACVICEYSPKSNIQIDNIHLLNVASEADILDFYSQENFESSTYEWPMDDLDGMNSIKGTRSDGTTVHLISSNDSMTLEEFRNRGNVLHLHGTSLGLIYALDGMDSCLSNVVDCPRGLSVEFWLFAVNMSDCVIVDSQTDGTTGMLIWMNSLNSTVNVLVKGMNHIWTDWVSVVTQQWIHIAVTWHPNPGLTTYLNFWPTHSQFQRVQLDDIMLESNSSSFLKIGECLNNLTDADIMIDDLQIRTHVNEEWEYTEKRLEKVKERVILDFNQPNTNSDTNIAFHSNDSYMTYIWRNSLFHTAARIDNTDSLGAAIDVSSTILHCFTRTDACHKPFTFSFWLRPRDMESNQIFFYAATKSTMGIEIVSTKLWYNSYTNDYLLEVYYDKTKYIFGFFIYLYDWSHLVLSADFENKQVTFFLNGQEVSNVTKSFVAKRVLPVYHVSFMKIGTAGKFDIDDIKFEYGLSGPQGMYALQSCNEYALAGFIGVQNVSIGRDRMLNTTATEINTCDLEIGYSGYHFSMDATINSDSLVTTNATVRLQPNTGENFTYIKGLSGEAVILNKTGLIIENLEPLCFGWIPDCFFGFTFAMWLKIEELDVVSKVTTLLEIGGNTNVNESGISLWCIESENTDPEEVDCSARLINITDKWTLDFSILKGSWIHVALTWNSHQTFKIYLNGHCTSELGVTSMHEVLHDATNYDAEPFYGVKIGHSIYDPGYFGQLGVDEIVIKDIDMTDEEIKQLFGTDNVCDEQWHYNNQTRLCYLFIASPKLNHRDSEMECQKYGGNLAAITNTDIHNWIGQTLTEEGITSCTFIDLKQLPREGFPMTWPDGSKPDFLTSFISTSSLSSTTRYCGEMKPGGGLWKWAPVPCTSLKGYICQAPPLYVNTPPIYLNSTSLNVSEDFAITGSVVFQRGITDSTMVYNKTMVTMSYSDSCMVNINFCHNGITLQFWMLVDIFAPEHTNITILSTKEDGNLYGLSVYLLNDSSELCLGIELTTTLNFTTWLVPITSHAWSHVALSFSNTTELKVYLNGISATFKSVSFNDNETAERVLGETVLFKTQFNYTFVQSSHLLLDNFTVREVYMTHPNQLYSDVYLNAPVFHLPLDDSLLITTNVSSISWFGNALSFNVSNTNPSSFLGQFSYDCLGSPDFCQEGFTFSVWMKPTLLSIDTTIMSAINPTRGIAIKYRVNYGGLTDTFWVIIRDNVDEKNIPFELETDVWSQLVFTWCINGTLHARVNGFLIDGTGAVTQSLTQSTIQPVVDLLFNPDSGFEGGIDEFLFYRRPIDQMETLELYKNSTFARNTNYWSFEGTPEVMEGNWTLMQVQGVNGSAVHITSGKDWLLLSSEFNQSSCIMNIDKCVHGFTLHLYVNFLEDRDSDQVIFTTGADNSEGLGITVMFTAKNKSLPFRRYFEAAVLTSSMEYRTWFNLEQNVWNHIAISWHKIIGIKVLVDGILASSNVTGASRLFPIYLNQEFCIGQRPSVGYSKGQLLLDELHFLDRAMFSDTIGPELGDIWRQFQHRTYSTSSFTTPEATLNECYESCQQSEICASFSFCTDRLYGECLSTNSTNEISVTDSGKGFDFFKRLRFDIPVKKTGCLNLTNTNYLIDNSKYGYINNDCNEYCKNMSYLFASTDQNNCLCGMNNATPYIDLWFGSDDMYYESCDNATQLDVYKLIGLSSFLNVTVPVTEFYIDVYPGFFVMVNETLTLTMNATVDSFAGYGIDTGNGSNMYYTGYNESRIVYANTGVYNLVIYALNEISVMMYSTNITVLTSVEGVSIYNEKLIGTDQEYTAVIWVKGGMEVTCNFSYGVGQTDTLYNDNVTEPYNFTFIYQSTGLHQLNVTCFNAISHAFNTSNIIVINSIRNLTLSASDAVLYGHNISLLWQIDTGTNVTFDILLNGVICFSSFSIEPEYNYTLDIPVATYLSVGTHEINITAVNIVSGPFNISKTIYIDREIILSTDIYHKKNAYRLDHSVTFFVNVSSGSNLNITLLFGDGEWINHYVPGDVFDTTYTFTHVYLSSNEYNTSLTVENSVSQNILNTILLADVPLHNTTFNIVPVIAQPGEPVNFTFYVPQINNSDAMYAFADINFGDGTDVDAMTVNINDGIGVIDHVYTTHGFYNVTVDLYNNISSVSFVEVVQVGNKLRNLTVIADNYFIEIGDPVFLTIEIGSGSGVTYTITFGDGANTTSNTNISYPDSQFSVEHMYGAIGHYPVQITASNVFGELKINITIEVHEAIRAIIPVCDRLGRVGHSMKFILQASAFGNFGTESCYIFDFGDGNKVMYGNVTCESNPIYQGIDFILAESESLIYTTHTYSKEGTYSMTINGSNPISSFYYQLNVRVLFFPCSIPKVEIYGFSKDISAPTTVYTAARLFIRAVADTNCWPVRNVIFKWEVTSIGHEYDTSNINMNPLPYLLIPANVLKYGKYKMNITIFIEGFPEFNDTSFAYIYATVSPLMLLIWGDEYVSVRSEKDLVLNASLSYDPDFDIHNTNFNFTWYCWSGYGTFSYDIHKNSLKTMRDCFYMFPVENNNHTILTIPKSYIKTGDIFTFVAVMSHGTRLEARSQTVTVQSVNAVELEIQCIDNCHSTVSSNKAIRLKGKCRTCNAYNKHSIPYSWSLFKIEGPNKTQISLEGWTKTGKTGPNLMIKDGLLIPGATYEIRLESGDAFTSKILNCNQQPYNGTCSSNLDYGMGFQSKFIFSCYGWLDEGDRMKRNVSVDSIYLENFEFRFYYQTVGRNPKMVPFFQIYGNAVKTPDVMLHSGLANYDYKVKIFIEIEDRYGSVETVSFTVQVSKHFDAPLSLLTGREMMTCQAERDMMCILILGQGFVNLANFQELSTTNSNEVIKEVVSDLTEFTDYIQDPVQMESASNLLNNITEYDTEKMSKDTKEKLSQMMTTLTLNLKSSLDSMSPSQRKETARNLLQAMIRYAQKTKYNPGCESNSCLERLDTGKKAVDLIPISKNLTAFLLGGTVPGEEPITIRLPEGNTKLHVEHKDVISLSNVSVSFEGEDVVDIPDITSALDPNIIESVYCELMIADNLHTVDSSVQAVKTRTTTFSFVQENGAIIHIQNLTKPIGINFYPPQLNTIHYDTVDLSPRQDTNMFVIEVRLNESDITPNILIHRQNSTVTIRCYYKVGQLPSRDSYDGHLNLTTGNDTSPTIVPIDIESKGQYGGTDVLYFGILTDLDTPSPFVNIGILALGCSYWNERLKNWQRNGVHIRKKFDISSATCLTTHLTTFGLNIFVPPNTIDFKNVWSKFSADNLAVMCTVGVIFGLYFIIIIFIRRADKKDKEKWILLPLADNVSTDRYHYHMTVYTGVRSGAGTTSDVYFVLGGDEDETEIRRLQDTAKRPLSTGSVNNYILSVPNPLGSLQFLRIWIDNGDETKISDWLLNTIIVKDIQNNQRYVFICDQWFALDKDDGLIERLLHVASEEEIQNFGHLFFTQTRKDLTDGHLWISVFSRPIHSNFTRVQRLSCCLSLLFLTMITNAMWYRSSDENTEVTQNIHLGPFTFSPRELSASLLGSLIVVPVSLVIITLFKKARPAAKKHTEGKESEADESTHPSGSRCGFVKGQPGKPGYMFPSKKEKEFMDDPQRQRFPSEKERKMFADRRSATPSSINVSFDSFHRSVLRDIYYRNGKEGINTDEDRDIKVEENKKKQLTLPHWCVYIAWILVAASTVTAAFFTILYSMEWGSEKSSKWLTAFILSFLESVLLLQPIKVVIVALVVALVFKTVDNEDEDYAMETFKPQLNTQPMNYTMPIYPDHRVPYRHNPPNEETTDHARQYRKKMNKLFRVIREIFAYLMYLTVLMILTYNNRDLNSFNMAETVRNSFLRAATKYDKNLINVSSAEGFWEWTANILVPALYTDGYYNGNTSDELNNFLSDNTHYRVGQARLRQARVKRVDDKCKVPIPMDKIITYCLPEYGVSTYDSNAYQPGWTSNGSSTNISSEPWIYHDSLSLNGLPVMGKYASYGGGGYILNLGNTADETLSLLDGVRDFSWIDRYTRAVFVEFNIFNPNVDLFGIVLLLVEFPATGGAFVWPKVAPLALYKYSGASALLVLIFDIIFVVFTVYYIVEFIRKFRSEGKQLLTGFWNFIDLLNIILSLSACAFYGVHFVFSQFALDEFRESKENYVNLQHIVLWDEVFGYIIAFLLFLSVLKLLQMIRFNTKITQLAGTLKKSCVPMASFFIVFSLTLMAFAMFGYLVFGKNDQQYSSIITTLETLMSMLLMKIDIHDMLQVNGALGSLFLFLFILFIVFGLINMLLSIINDAFTQVRQDPDYLPDDPEVVNFLLEQFKRLVFGYAPAKPVRKKDSGRNDVDNRMTRIERRMVSLLSSLSREKI